MMETMNSMEELWTQSMADALGRLFAFADEHKVQSIVMDVKQRKINFAFDRTENPAQPNCDADFYNVMYEKYIDVKKAKIAFDTWFNSMLGEPKAEHFQMFIGEALTKLLKGDFFVSDKFITDAERNISRSIFKELNATDISLMNKCCVMLRCVRWEDGRFHFDDKEHLGGYMKMNEHLSPYTFRTFFRFVALCEVAYKKQDSMAISALKDKVEVCLKNALADVNSLKSHVQNMETTSYLKLWEYIIYNKVSIAEKLQCIAPNGFKGGYNQKLVCNIVGIMIDCGVFDVNKSQANELLYGQKNVKSYISNYAADGTDSVLTREERKYIENIIRNNIIAQK